MDEKDEKESLLNVLNNINQEEDNKENEIIIRKNIWDSFHRIDQPKELSIKLFPHQLVSIYNMENLEQIRKIKASNIYNRGVDTFYITDFGILGDIPGYGKSFSIVSLIVRDKMQWDITKFYERADINTVNSCFKILNNELFSNWCLPGKTGPLFFNKCKFWYPV